MLWPSAFSEEEQYARERRRMVETQLRNRGIGDERVLGAIRRIPRHEFVPLDFRSQAYGDHPIPIGEARRFHSRSLLRARYRPFPWMDRNQFWKWVRGPGIR